MRKFLSQFQINTQSASSLAVWQITHAVIYKKWGMEKLDVTSACVALEVVLCLSVVVVGDWLNVPVLPTKCLKTTAYLNCSFYILQRLLVHWYKLTMS